MLGVIKQASMWIVENALGLFKPHSVLDPIALVLPFVPIEPHTGKGGTCQLEKVGSALGSKGRTSPAPLIEPNDKAREAACDRF